MTHRSSVFRFVSAVCCGTLIALPLQDGYVSLAAPDAATTLANSLRALQDAENTAPRDHWDPKYVEAQLGNDPGRTFAWVRDHTYWIPYHGILRGPVGVLMDRQGDSLDRALLLATMLKDEGQTVRLAHGTMAAAQADRLIAPLLTARLRRQLDSRPPSRPVDDMAAVAAKYDLDATSVRARVSRYLAARSVQQRQVDSLSAQMSRLIRAAGTPPEGDDSRNLSHAQGALSDHWWVETQTGGLWRAWDLVAGNPAKPLATADRTIDPASLPPDLYHQITIRVIVERWTSGTTSETAALEQTLRPALTIGLPITLSIAPGDPLRVPPGQDVITAFRAHAAWQREWTPSLDIGKQHIVQNAITDSGSVTMPSNNGDVMAVARGATHGLASAIDGVFGTPPSAPSAAASTLSAAWIEYRIAAPGESLQTVRRQIFDLPGPAARSAKSTTWGIDDAGKLTRSLSLMMTTDILPMNCALAPQFVEHLSRQTMLANADLAQDIAGRKIADDLAGAQAAGSRFVKTGTSLYGLALRRMNSSPVAPLVYVDRPDILTRHLFIAATGNTLTPMSATDIVVNGVGIDPTAQSRFPMAIAQGVYDTIGEAVLHSTKPNAGNAAWAYDAGGEWVTITAAGDPALATLPVTADVRERINAALASKYMVITPRSRVMVGGVAFAGWWQVDRVTGDTLGMGETGWGQELAEYAVVTMATAAAWGFVNGWLNCKLAPSSAGGSPIVAMSLPAPIASGPFDLFEARVDARGDGCLAQAFLSAGLALIGEGLGAGLSVGKGGPGNSGGALPEEPVDPLANTQPMPAVGGESGASGGGGAGGGGAGGGNGPGSGQGPTGNPAGSPGMTNPGPEEAAKFKDAQQRFERLLNSRDVNGRDQALKEMLRNQPRPIPSDMADALDRDIQTLADQRAAAGFGPDAGKNGGKVIVGDPAGNIDTRGQTQPVPIVGGSGGTGGTGDEIPPTLRSAGVGSGNGQSGSPGGSGSSDASRGGESGTQPGLGPATPRTPTSPGLGPCTPGCGPSGSTTVVGLGGAINALGGS